MREIDHEAEWRQRRKDRMAAEKAEENDTVLERVPIPMTFRMNGEYSGEKV